MADVYPKWNYRLYFEWMVDSLFFISLKISGRSVHTVFFINKDFPFKQQGHKHFIIAGTLVTDYYNSTINTDKFKLKSILQTSPLEPLLSSYEALLLRSGYFIKSTQFSLNYAGNWLVEAVVVVCQSVNLVRHFPGQLIPLKTSRAPREGGRAAGCQSGW